MQPTVQNQSLALAAGSMTSITRHRGARLGSCITIIAATLQWGCLARHPLVVPPEMRDSTAVGKAYVAQVDGSNIVLEHAFITPDSITGMQRVSIAGEVRVRRYSVPWSDVRSAEQERTDAPKTVQFLLAFGAVWALVTGLSGMGPGVGM